MTQEKLTLLNEYLKIGMSPILIEDIDAKVIQDAIILPASSDSSQLNGHYESINFVAPNWYQELINQKNPYPILIIENLNQLNANDQLKYIEILKYKKVSTFDLPKNCIILVTVTNLKEKHLSEEVYSLLTHI